MLRGDEGVRKGSWLQRMCCALTGSKVTLRFAKGPEETEDSGGAGDGVSFRKEYGRSERRMVRTQHGTESRKHGGRNQISI